MILAWKRAGSLSGWLAWLLDGDQKGTDEKAG